MPRISPSLPSDGDEITASSNNTPLTALLSLINGNLDQDNIADGGVTPAKLAASVIGLIYPIGSVYTNMAVSTNPNSLFGFGTWVAFGTGQVLVGVDTGQTEFATLGLTGGEKQHTLTTGELAVHNHGVVDPGHTHNLSQNAIFQSGGGTTAVVPFNGSLGNATTTSSTTGIGTNNNGSGQGHNNLQPYITVYMWKRTA